MSDVGFEEMARKKRVAMVNCSMAMLEAIRSYGFAATLDFVVRISNYDSIVSELLPYFPSLASVAMLEAWNIRPGSKNGEGNPEDPATQSELPKPSAG
jgi:hypothetical protein